METKRTPNPANENTSEAYDYTFVETVGHIAIYDDMRSEPRVIEIQPAETAAYIEALATGVYTHAREAGGSIPYTVIREVSENFIHAQFKEALVTILDGGNTIRFADHGPGIPSKEKAQMPGFSSAVEPMRDYIRGVGSGLPRVREYLELSNGTISIEDNLGTGAVVTISLVGNDFSEESTELADAFDYRGDYEASSDPQPFAEAYTPAPAASYSYNSAPAYGAPTATGPYGVYPVQSAPYVPAQPYGGYPVPAQPVPYPAYATAPQHVGYGYAPVAPAAPHLNDREKMVLSVLRDRGPARQVDLCNVTGISASSMNSLVKNLEHAGLLSDNNKVKHLTEFGVQMARNL